MFKSDYVERGLEVGHFDHAVTRGDGDDRYTMDDIMSIEDSGAMGMYMMFTGPVSVPVACAKAAYRNVKSLITNNPLVKGIKSYIKNE